MEEENKRKQAIALSYEPGDEAPKIVASGTGIVAERIIEKAKESQVEIYEDSKLADTLSRLDIGE
jgi:flagellar biosynthesis protein